MIVPFHRHGAAAPGPTEERLARALRVLARGAALALVLTPGAAFADVLSRHVAASTEFGLVRFGGSVGDVTSTGLRMGMRQGMQFGVIGFTLGISTDSFLTRQPAPPQLHGLRTLHLAAGPRGAWAFSRFRVLGSVEFVRMSALQNPIANTLGAEVNRNGIGSQIGLRWEPGGLLYAELGGRMEWLFSARTTTRASIATFSVGILSPF